MLFLHLRIIRYAKYLIANLTSTKNLPFKAHSTRILNMKIKIKTGIGFDVHAFEEGRPLIIGGVTIPYKAGLLGHSDADVLAHALTDAILGPTLGMDIGTLFPDTDPHYAGADSVKLLERAVTRVLDAGYKIGSADCVIIAQLPKMAPHIPEMRRVLSIALGVEEEDLTIKATTTEYMGFTGRGEGIAALAVATVYRD
jgi:2-C-methyl-D-erythritol 2,4-cyclodiphosphate synthase